MGPGWLGLPGSEGLKKVVTITLLVFCFLPTNVEGAWGADFATRFGGVKAASTVYAVPFTIVKGDTYALCNLDFDTNLRKIDYAEVSCDLFYTFSPESSWFGLTSHTWSFFADIDGDVYDISATISLNPKTNTLFDLRLCFTGTCSAASGPQPSTTSTLLQSGSGICECDNSEEKPRALDLGVFHPGRGSLEW